MLVKKTTDGASIELDKSDLNWFIEEIKTRFTVPSNKMSRLFVLLQRVRNTIERGEEDQL